MNILTLIHQTGRSFVQNAGNDIRIESDKQNQPATSIANKALKVGFLGTIEDSFLKK